jgi:hypothetical protein
VNSAPILSFDVESNGLHGEGFAIGAVMLSPDGAELATFYARCPITGDVDPWVRDNVLPALVDALETHATARAMRDAWWLWMTERMEGAVVVVDCGWPVEAGMLSACVADDPSRAFKGPYPLHEVATLVVAAGGDPLASYAERVLPPDAFVSHRKHHPVDDARVSAHLARLARSSIANGTFDLC